MSAVEDSLETQARIGALRCEGGPHSPTGHLLRQLADEIEQLRGERDTFYMDYRMKCDEETKALHVECERLSAEVAASKEEHHFQACLTRDLLPYQERAVKAEAEIERLRAEVAHWKEARQMALDGGDLLKQEVDRLRELLLALRRNPHIEEILRWDANLAYLERIDAALGGENKDGHR